MIRRVALALAAAFVCVAAGSGQEDEGGPAAVAAAALARADGNAQLRGARRQLVRDLVLLDRMGVRAVQGGEDPRAEWRRAARLRGEPEFRGRVLGPAFSRGWIGPGESARIDQQFLGGQKSNLAVAATPAQQIEVAVTDPGRGAVCRARASCTWTPLYTQRYTIVVRNPGRERVRYYLVVD